MCISVQKYNINERLSIVFLYFLENVACFEPFLSHVLNYEIGE